MTGKFLHIGFRWGTVVKEKELEAVFNYATDWLKYAPNCWILWTTTDPAGWWERIKPHVTEKDRVLICEININNRQGWLEPWIWDWIKKPR